MLVSSRRAWEHSEVEKQHNKSVTSFKLVFIWSFVNLNEALIAFFEIAEKTDVGAEKLGRKPN